MNDFKKCIIKVFPETANNITEETLEIKNCISNIVGSKGINIKRFTFKIDMNKYDVIIKYSSPRIISNGLSILSNNNPILALEILKNHKIFDYDDSGVREKCIYNNIDNTLKNKLIPFYGNYKNYLIIKYIDINNNYDYKRIIKELIKIHAFYYGKKEIVKEFKLNNNTPNDYKKAKKILLKMYHKLDNRINDEININNFILNIDKYMDKYTKHRTLTHNDLSTRNIFMNKEKLYIYDWELASYQNPEHDLIELLVYSLHEISKNDIKGIILKYKEEFYKRINKEYKNEEYKEILMINLKQFIAIRLTMLRTANKTIKIDFIDRLINNCNKLYFIIEEMF